LTKAVCAICCKRTSMLSVRCPLGSRAQGLQIAEDLAGGVHLNDPPAVLAAQNILLGQFNACVTHLVAARHKTLRDIILL